MYSALSIGLGLGLASFGCIDPVRTGAIDPGRTEESATITICDITRCGTNSPELDPAVIKFHELNLRGLPNTQGLRVSRFVKGGIVYTPQVVRGQLRGVRTSVTITGTDLVGAQLTLIDGVGREFAITVASVGQVSARPLRPTYPGSSDLDDPMIETYDLRWSRPGMTELEPICPSEGDTSDTWGMLPGWAVLSEGDQINAELKTVDPNIDLNWFNIGCAGYALAKLVLAGYTEAGQDDEHKTTWEDRQALLKMLVADYCGNGTSFTVPGQPLYWQGRLSFLKFQDPVRTPVEARWSSQGAICLGEPRLDANAPSQWPAGLSRPVITAIQNACSELPPCTNGDPDNLDGAIFVSANPLL
jgi:hypothetical protein